MIKEWWDNGATRPTLVIVGTFVLCITIFFLAWFFPIGKVTYPNDAVVIEPAAIIIAVEPEIPEHIITPDTVKAVYLTSWAAGHRKFREHLFDLVENTEINSVVIDVKDYTGRISFTVDDSYLKEFGAVENRIPDIKEFIQALHAKDVYVIGRISAFQDSFLVKNHPEWAVKTQNGDIWQDYKGVKWLDAGATPVWDYLVAIGKEAYAQGFDEINFDYIRFPSDGNMRDISYDWKAGRSRDEIMRSFFEYINLHFASTSIVTSADLFGLTTTSADDLGIGQVLEHALVNFDYVAPMVYPSHYSSGFYGISKPAQYPYEVVKNSMVRAVERAVMSTTSPSKLRPWLQDFDLGADYTPTMVRAQIQATYDSGLNSWMLWNAGSIYTKEALEPIWQDVAISTTTMDTATTSTSQAGE